MLKGVLKLQDSPYASLLNDQLWGPEIRTIQSLPESHQARPALVGGAVRDLLLGRTVKDLDISTAVPDSAGRLALAFAQATGRTVVEYSHVQTIFRVTSAGAPQVDFTDPIGGTRESDLARRDFTVNAMALGLAGEEEGRFFDPLCGRKDLERKLVRMSSPETLDNDPLRLLRAFRFRAQLGFAIDPQTLEAISLRAEKLRGVAGERIQLELLESLEPDGADTLVADLDRAGLLEVIFPELKYQKGVEQNTYHHLDVWEHTLEALRQIERILAFDEEILQPYRERLKEYVDHRYPSGHSRRALIKLGVLLHDIAKPQCRGQREDGRITFISHERFGASIVKKHLSRLRFPAYEREFVTHMIAGHLRPAVLGRDDPDRPRFAYRFFRDYGEAALAIMLMSLADRLAAQGPTVTEEINQRHRNAVAYLLSALYERAGVIVRPPSLINGEELMAALGLEEGPLVGYLLGKVREAQVMGKVKSREEAVSYCRDILSRGC